MPTVGTTHHVKIGDIYCVLAPGGYRRRPAPLRGARVSTGDPGYNDLAIWQHWVQHCWAGGIGADKWVDDSMYDSGVGVDTTIHEQMSLSRDLSRPTGGSLAATSLDHPRRFLVYKKPNGNKRLYCLTMPASGSGIGSRLWKWTQATSEWDLVKTFASDQQATSIVAHSGEMAIGFDTGLIKSNDNPDDSDDWVNRQPPKGESGPVTAMMKYRQRLYVAYGRKVYRRKNNWSVDGNTEFYDTLGSGWITSMETHLGFLYMGSNTGHIHRTDGNNTFDIWQWDGETEVVSLRSFDGRLFVGTFEFTDDADVGYGGIYQFTGSAVTQLKRWGKTGRATINGNMRVYDRKLFYGASGLWGMNKNSAGTDLGGFGVAVYDPIEDAHSIWSTNKDTTTFPDSDGFGRDWIVDDVIFWQGKMHVSVRGYGLFKSDVNYRDYIDGTINYDTTTTTATGSANTGFMVSSVYDAGTPGLIKLWRSSTVEVFLPSNNVSVTIQYATDRSRTWTTIGTVRRALTGTMATTSGLPTVTGTGTDFTKEVDIGDTLNIQSQVLTVLSVDSDTQLTMTANAGASVSGTAYHTKNQFRRVFLLNEVRSPRIQYRLVLNSSSATESPFVTAVTFAYLPIPEPNWLWDLTVIVAERVELLDETEDTQDLDDQINTLAQYFRDQNVISFTDRDGTLWPAGDGNGVLLWDFVQDHHVPGRDGEPTEAFLRISLLEVAQEY